MASYTIKTGDTLSGIAQKNKTTIADIMRANPQIKNPNFIQAGASIAMPEQAYNVPSVPTPLIQKPFAMNQTANLSFPTPSLATGATSTPTIGPVTPWRQPAMMSPKPQQQKINVTPVNYGQNQTNAQTLTPGYNQETVPDASGGFITSGSSGTAAVPAVPEVPSETAKAVASAEKVFEESSKISEEELSTQEQLDKLIESTKKAYLNIEDQPIPMQFITGQLASVERRATALAEPLQSKLARLQAKRTATIDASKFALERADKKFESEQAKLKPTAVSSGESIVRYNPLTGKYDTVFGGTSESNLKTEVIDDNGVKKLINKETGEVIETYGTLGPTQSPYQAERATRVLESVDELSKIADQNQGIFGRTAAMPMPEALRTEAWRNFIPQLDVLKSNIITSELTAMREASKTGGALGQISDRESKYLSEALGALDIRSGMTYEAFKSQLNKIRSSIQRWRDAVASQGGVSTQGSLIYDF